MRIEEFEPNNNQTTNESAAKILETQRPKTQTENKPRVGFARKSIPNRINYLNINK